MDPITSMFFWAIFWGAVGLITTFIWGLDAPKFVADVIILIVVLVGPMIFFSSQGYTDIDKTATFLENYITNFANMLPGLVIGDAVGSFFAKIKELF